MRRQATLPTLLAGLVLLAGCHDQSEPLGVSGPPAASSDLKTQPVGPYGLDGEFARIARSVPGFGGLFFDDEGNPVVYLTDLSQQAAARIAVAPILRRRQYVVGLAASPRAASQNVVFRQGEFSFNALLAWADQITGAVFRIPRVGFLDIDESTNRIVLGVYPGVDRERVTSLVVQSGIPAQAVQLKEVPPVRLSSHELTDLFTPAPGGVKISRAYNGGWCTMGFNARRYDTFDTDPSVYVVTADHCTGSVADDTPNEKFYQPDQQKALFGLTFATEMYDPPTYLGRDCPEGYQCRWSDATLAKYDGYVNPEFGYVARPYFNSITVNAAYPRFRITVDGQYPMDNEIVHKVGQTTGLTSGPVRHTCIRHVHPEWVFPTILLWCQDFADYDARQGDSGAPVFLRQQFSQNDESDITLVGLHWGMQSPEVEPSASYAVFSSMMGLEIDFGVDLRAEVP